ncbi:MAG: PQQ-binding-like beta-propeller repeat protein [Deltaproteobacteria bacterium]|nr:PQQ-binding-like beta-propeller repeat protein [Deltaproteobacteria bacterium]
MQALKTITTALLTTALLGLGGRADAARPAAPAEPASAARTKAPVGWLSWRGSGQDGFALVGKLPEHITLGGEGHLWTYPLSGRGTPVVADGRLFTLGYRGTGPDLQELLVALDAATGKLIWERGFNDFLSDIIYERYSLGSPVIDAETGNVYAMTGAGLMVAFTRDGEPLWQRSMMEEFGRLTFPNGRTGSPVIVGDRVIVHAITTSWGRLGPARDRIYAFDKRDGTLLWISTPGTPPQDSSYSTPVLGTYLDRPVLWVGTGCGNVVCVDVRDGSPIWRMPISSGGVNSSLIALGDEIIAIHGNENLDSTRTGRLVRIDPRGAGAAPGASEPVVLPAKAEKWRADVGAFSSSPALSDGWIYVTEPTGDLVSVDVETGKLGWTLKLGAEQIHASPLYADGRLWVPLNDGSFSIVRPEPDEGVLEQRLQLEGHCLGAPAAADGRIFVHTTAALYAFGGAGQGWKRPWEGLVLPEDAAKGPAARLEVRPAELAMVAGSAALVSARRVDAQSRPLPGPPLPASALTFEPLGPGAPPKLARGADGALEPPADAGPWAGELRVRAGELTGAMRLRVLPKAPWREDFESFSLAPGPGAANPGPPGADPPAAWIGGKLKWRVEERDGNKVLVKTTDRLLFQRSMTFMGPPEMSGYTVEADVMSEGSRRGMSSAGVIVQRYIVALQGNQQTLEVQSNYDRVRYSVPFAWKPSVWYRIRARVDVAADGSGVVRAKAWPRDEPEPAAWTLEYHHAKAHTHGSPGLFGFAVQAQYRVFVDNIAVLPRAAGERR